MTRSWPRRRAGGARGDHFGKPGANDRIWNALEKLAVKDPEAFVDYYANDLVALGARAWLGPGYQVTAQANIVRPGGKQVRRCTATTTWASWTPSRRPAIPRTSTRMSPAADLAGRGRARGHAGRVGADALSAALAEVRLGLPRLLAAGVPGLLRGQPRPVAAHCRRSRVVQPGSDPRRRDECLERHPADGEPAPGVTRPSVARWSRSIVSGW
jgi:hypothetical protein